MKDNFKKITKFILKLTVSSVFVSWLVLKTNWSEVSVYVQKISVFHIAVYVSVLILGMIISAWKWKMLLAHKDIKVSLKKCFQLYLTGAFINNFMPSTIGGDTYRAYQIGKEHQKFHAVSSSVVFDRLSGLFSLMILTGIISIFKWSEISTFPELKFTVVAVLLLMHGFIFFGILIKFGFWKKIAEKFPKIIREFVSELAGFRQKGAFWKAIGISALFSFVGLALVNGVLFWSLGVNVSISDYLSVIFLVSIISSLPISINNIGVKEWAYVTFFGFFGVQASAVVAVALLSRVLQMIVSFTALPIYLKAKK